MNGDFLRPPIMMSLDDVAISTAGALQGSRVAISGVTTDSRRVSAGDLFVALTGERFDGHEYVEEAMRRGAVAALVSRRVQADLPLPQVIVDDTRLALGRLAPAWRARFALPRIAKPDVALVNNAHRAHVGLLGDVAAVARAKGEVYAGLSASGIALVNADDAFAEYWKGLNPGRRVVTFGLSPSADVHASIHGS